MPLSVTEPREPKVVPNTTVPPELVRLLPLLSLACTVMVEVLLPLAVILVGEALITVCATLTAPGINVTVALPPPMATPPMVPDTVAVPVVVLLVNVAV